MTDTHHRKLPPPLPLSLVGRHSDADAPSSASASTSALGAPKDGSGSGSDRTRSTSNPHTNTNTSFNSLSISNSTSTLHSPSHPPPSPFGHDSHSHSLSHPHSHPLPPPPSSNPNHNHNHHLAVHHSNETTDEHKHNNIYPIITHQNDHNNNNNNNNITPRRPSTPNLNINIHAQPPTARLSPRVPVAAAGTHAHPPPIPYLHLHTPTASSSSSNSALTPAHGHGHGHGQTSISSHHSDSGQTNHLHFTHDEDDTDRDDKVSLRNMLSETPRSELERIQTIEYYLKQAISARDYSALKDLLVKAQRAGMDSKSELLLQAQGLVSDKESEHSTNEVSTLRFYLKQSMDARHRDGLAVALSKASPVAASLQNSTQRRLNMDFFNTIDEAKKMKASLDKQEGETITFYLKQGIQLKNRETLQQAVEKADKEQDKTYIDKESLHTASKLLQELDAQHLILFYLTTAIKQKDETALEVALVQAKTLNMAATTPEVAQATKLLAELKARKPKKVLGIPGRSGGKFSLFGGMGRRGHDKKDHFQLFGGPLQAAVARSDRNIPKVCYQCMDFLRASGLAEPGLFRVPGNKDVMELIQASFEDDGVVELKDVHDAAGVFKQYLRSLPEPLIPYEQYTAFVKAGAIKGNDAERNRRLGDLLHTLPKDSLALLDALIDFLVDVSQHSQVNKMTPDNLAIVFAPNLLRPRVETPQSMMTEMSITISVIAAFIIYYNDIFGKNKSANSATSTSTSTASSSLKPTTSATATATTTTTNSAKSDSEAIISTSSNNLSRPSSTSGASRSTEHIPSHPTT